MTDTTDDLTPGDPLASAYLDGETTAEERARVEASAELLDEVERLRQVRAVLGATTEPPAISAREANLAAALDVWDRMPDAERTGESTPAGGIDAAAAAAITTPPPTNLSGRRERRSRTDAGKWLLGAAAGLVVIAGAGIALQSISTTGSDDAADSQEVPADEATSEADEVAEDAGDVISGAEVQSEPFVVDPDDIADEDSRAASDAETADTAAMEGDAPTGAGEGDDADSTLLAADAADDTAADDTAADEAVTSEEQADAAASDEAADGGEAPPAASEDELAVLSSIEELAEFGAIAADAPSDPEAPAADIPRPFATCDDEFSSFDLERFAGPAEYLGEPVIVALDLDTDPFTVIAYRDDDCTVVARTVVPADG